MKLSYNNFGFNEIIISNDCEWQDFYDFADKLAAILQTTFKDQLHDFDSCYWAFDFEECNMMAHYNIYMGISIYPEKCKSANEIENQKIVSIFNTLQAHGSSTFTNL